MAPKPLTFNCEYHEALGDEKQHPSWKVPIQPDDPMRPDQLVVHSKDAACPKCGNPGVAVSRKTVVIVEPSGEPR